MGGASLSGEPNAIAEVPIPFHPVKRGAGAVEINLMRARQRGFARRPGHFRGPQLDGRGIFSLWTPLCKINDVCYNPPTSTQGQEQDNTLGHTANLRSNVVCNVK